MAASGEVAAAEPDAAQSGPAGYDVRPLSPLELGLMYVWMERDEKTAGTTRWWSAGGAGLQQRWEEAAGWVDEELDGASWVGLHKRPDATGEVDAVESALAPALPAERRATAVSRLTGAAAAPPSLTPPPARFLGAFVPGVLGPVGFVATRSTRASAGPVDYRVEDARRTAGRRCSGSGSGEGGGEGAGGGGGEGAGGGGGEGAGGGGGEGDGGEGGVEAGSWSSWVIDVLGVARPWRKRGVGTALARHCLEQARAGASTGARYAIDSVPAAVGFWTRLGFEEVEATGEQAALMERGGDRPMVMVL